MKYLNNLRVCYILANAAIRNVGTSFGTSITIIMCIKQKKVGMIKKNCNAI